jgi:hypothetical protein
MIGLTFSMSSPIAMDGYAPPKMKREYNWNHLSNLNGLLPRKLSSFGTQTPMGKLLVVEV